MFMQDQTSFVETQNVVQMDRQSILSDGISAETLVETDTGWRRAELLRCGDRVQTMDGGLRQIERLERRFIDLSNDPTAPVFLVSIPGGVLNACSESLCMPDQKVLLENAAVEEQIGAPMVLVRVGDLCGLAGIKLIRPAGVTHIVRPILAEEELIWANTGMLCHFGAQSDDGHPAPSPFFQELSREQARLAVFADFRCDADILQVQAA